MIRRMSNVLLTPAVYVFALLSIATALFAFNFDAFAETCWDETTNGACEGTNVPVFTCHDDSEVNVLIGQTGCSCEWKSGQPDHPPGGQPSGVLTYEVVNETISAVFEITAGFSSTDDGNWIPCQRVYECQCDEEESYCEVKDSENPSWNSTTKAKSTRVTGHPICPEGC